MRRHWETPCGGTTNALPGWSRRAATSRPCSAYGPISEFVILELGSWDSRQVAQEAQRQRQRKTWDGYASFTPCRRRKLPAHNKRVHPCLSAFCAVLRRFPTAVSRMIFVPPRHQSLHCSDEQPLGRRQSEPLGCGDWQLAERHRLAGGAAFPKKGTTECPLRSIQLSCQDRNLVFSGRFIVSRRAQ